MRHSARGFTLIEVLVVIMILGVVAALLLPAVGQAREAARRIACANNLKQIGIALCNYENANSVYPPTIGTTFSAQSRLLPFLEQTSIYNQINFDSAIVQEISSNASISLQKIQLFVCPSDNGDALINYSCNSGCGVPLYGDNGFFADAIRPVDIADGLSQTVAFSEIVGGSRLHSNSRNAFFIFNITIQNINSYENFLRNCDSANIRSNKTGNLRGWQWIHSDYLSTLYNHVFSINKNTCSCGPSSSGVWSASSLHASGAQVLFGDGHFQFVKDSITPGVWSALGSRHGGEISNPF